MMKMFRRTILMMMVIMSFIAFTACKKNEGDSDGKKGEEVNNQLEVKEKEEGEEPTTAPTEEPVEPTVNVEDNKEGEKEEYIPDFIRNSESIGYTQYQFYTAGLDVKAPALHQVSHGLENFHYKKEVTIGYYAGSKTELGDIKKPEDIMELSRRILVLGTSRYVYGEFESFEFDSIEKVTINDIEMVRYEGNMVVKEFQQKKRYVVAYTFIYNDTPNAIFGVAGDPVQEQEVIDELIHNVDESVKTIAPGTWAK